MKIFKLLSTSIFAVLLPNILCSQPGTLDTSFGVDGKVSRSFGSNTQTESAVQQPDGKMVFVGRTYASAPGSGFFVARYSENGVSDSTFGIDGYTTTLIGDHCTANSVALQNDGKIVVAGTTYAPTGDSNYSDLMVVRYNQDGSLDTTFGNEGIKVINMVYSQIGNSILIQNDGKIIVGGYFTSLQNPNSNCCGLIRFNTDGSVDTTFGVAGFIYTPLSYRGEILEMKFTTDGGILAVGRNWQSYVIVRYDADGQVVNSFGSDGNGMVEVLYNSISLLYGCVISDDDKIFVVGGTYNEIKYNAFIAKYSADGILDNTFGQGGIILRDFGTGISSHGRDIAIDYNGNLIVGLGVGPSSNYDFALESYNLDGVLNTNFGDNGYFSTTFGSGHDYFRTLLIQPNNKIVMAGSKGRFVAARVNNDPLLLNDEFLRHKSQFQITPNPIKEDAVLTFELKSSDRFDIDLFDCQGHLISNLAKNKSYPQGSHQEILELSNIPLSKGIYFLKIGNGNNSYETVKVVKL